MTATNMCSNFGGKWVSPHFKPLFWTRWIVWTAAIGSVLKNYNALTASLEEVSKGLMTLADKQVRRWPEGQLTFILD